MPHTWHDVLHYHVNQPPHLFQSTCHIRGMTRWAFSSVHAQGISIHMPHTWHDFAQSSANFFAIPFQSTCHIRGMTTAVCSNQHAQQISIHMPHTWHDPRFPLSGKERRISIHMPHTWHDTGTSSGIPHSSTFQSTCHIRGMTPRRRVRRPCPHMSIHMPHTWHDPFDCLSPVRSEFQSTCHIRGMTCFGHIIAICKGYFNPHATYVA